MAALGVGDVVVGALAEMLARKERSCNSPIPRNRSPRGAGEGLPLRRRLRRGGRADPEHSQSEVARVAQSQRALNRLGKP